MKRIGLYFGSFNPIHNTHKFVVDYLLEKYFVDEIELVVSPQNPFKTDLCDFDKRCEMCEIVFNGNDKVHVNRIESTLPTPSYTINTLEMLEKDNTDNVYYIIMGMDNWENIMKWKRYGEIVRKYPILVLPRFYDEKQLPNQNYDMFYYMFSKMQFDLIIPNSKTKLVDNPISDLSASFIRNSIKNDEDISTFIDKRVYNYIKTNKLYK